MSDAPTTRQFGHLEDGAEPGAPGVPGPGAPPRGSTLAALAGEIAGEVHRPPVTYKVPDRPGYAIRYSCDIDAELLRVWAERTRIKGGGGDTLRQALLVLSNQAEAILRQGEPIGEGGADVTFADRDFRELLGAGNDATLAVRRFYGNDGVIVSHAEELIADAGYGAQVEKVDPTNP